MYELFVLGELMTEAKHGYALQHILRDTVGPARKISWGTLYPLISRLIESGKIYQRQEPNEGGRQKKIYELTEYGRTRFYDLMAKPLEPHADIELLFQFKMTYFQYVEKEIQLACLEQYLGYLRYELHYIDEAETSIQSKQECPEKKRVQVLRMLRLRKHSAKSTIRWLLDEIEWVAASGNPDVED